MTAPIKAIGFRPFANCFLSIKENNVDVILVFPMCHAPRELYQKSGRGTRVISAHKMKHRFVESIVMTGNRYRFSRGARKFEDYICHPANTVGRLSIERIRNKLSTEWLQSADDPLPESLQRFRARRSFSE